MSFGFHCRGHEVFNLRLNIFSVRHGRTKKLPPLIKTFTWRLIRRALATAVRASRYASHIDSNCASGNRFPHLLPMLSPNTGMVHLSNSYKYSNHGA
jgi:hypothetical protein